MEGKRRVGKRDPLLARSQEKGRGGRHHSPNPAESQSVYSRVVAGDMAPGRALLGRGVLFLQERAVSEVEEHHILPLAVISVPRNGKGRDW